MRWGWLLFVPFTLFIVVFAIIPAFGMFVSSIISVNGLTFQYYESTFTGQYLHSFITTTALSLYSSLFSMAWGMVITWSLVRTKNNWIQHTVTALSSTMANFAGLPLAVAFMTTLGMSGLLTELLKSVNINLIAWGWNLASFSGLMVVYTSFLVPLCIILLLPALSSLKAEWEEASATLGAPFRTYVWRVVGPMMLPSLVGTFALLFANAFSTYVTAFVVAGGSVNLIPLIIGYMINGNVSLDVSLGDSLAIEEMVVLGLAVVLFLSMQKKRASKNVGSTTGEVQHAS